MSVVTEEAAKALLDKIALTALLFISNIKEAVLAKKVLLVDCPNDGCMSLRLFKSVDVNVTVITRPSVPVLLNFPVNWYDLVEPELT